MPEQRFDIAIIGAGPAGMAAAVAAAAHGARVVHHGFVPIAEAARVTVAPQARHDWLLVVDPDEEVPPALADEALGIPRQHRARSRGR